VSCGVGCRLGSNLVLLWLWCRLAATAPLGPLVWEPPYAAGAALKDKKNQTKQKTKEITIYKFLMEGCVLTMVATCMLKSTADKMFVGSGLWLPINHDKMIDCLFLSLCFLGNLCGIMKVLWIQLSINYTLIKQTPFLHPCITSSAHNFCISFFLFFSFFLSF